MFRHNILKGKSLNQHRTSNGKKTRRLERYLEQTFSRSGKSYLKISRWASADNVHTT